jgi:hypothetical protein
MPFTYSTLGQIQGTAAVGTYASVYQAASPTIVSSVTICNQAASSMTYRLAVASSTSPATSEFIVYGATVPANDTVTLSLGITLSTGKYIVASSSANTSSFAAFGTVVS